MTALLPPREEAGSADEEGKEGGGHVPTLGEVGLDGFAPYLINRISACYNAGMAEVLRKRGLTIAQMRSIAVLSVQPGLTVNELAVYTVLEQSTMSRTLDAMALAGLVERRPRAGDGRVREVVLTEAGMAAVEEVWPIMREAEARMLAGLDLEERATFLATLRKILTGIAPDPG